MKKMVLLIAAILLAVCSATGIETPAFLKDAYKDAFLMGSAVNRAIVSGRDKASQEIVIAQFNTITAENSMKAESVNPRPGVYNFGPADQFVAFGQKHEMFIIGHTLIWHNQTPAWFFQDDEGKPNTRAAQIKRMRSHIEAVAGRYAGRVDAWDVVNEVIDNDGSYRPTTWVKGIGNGDDLVKLAFKFASEYAPDTELYYNDFNAWRPAKRDGIVRMVKMLQAEGIRIDGVGIQGHWGLNYPKTGYIEAAIDAYASLGIKVMITELDVDVLPLTREGQIIGSVMSDPQFQLEEFREYLDPYAQGLPDVYSSNWLIVMPNYSRYSTISAIRSIELRYGVCMMACHGKTVIRFRAEPIIPCCTIDKGIQNSPLKPYSVYRPAKIRKPGSSESYLSVCRQQKWHSIRHVVRRGLQVFSCMQENT